MSAPKPRIRSQASSQFWTGPSQMIGVPPTKRMSPVKTTLASGQVDEDVAGGVGGADLDQLHRSPADLERRACR